MIGNSPILAQTLIVELEGRSVQLEAQVAKMEKRLEQFERKGVSAGTGVAAGGEEVGRRYAHASLRISEATESMARAGKVSGEATRQMLAQGANMAFMFGPEGAIAGGIAIVGLAVVELFMSAQREMEATRKKFDEELGQMAKSKDLKGVGQRLQDLFSGDETAAIGGKRENESDAAFFGRQFGLQRSRQVLEGVDVQIKALRSLMDASKDADAAFQDSLLAEYERLKMLKRELPAVVAEMERQHKAATEVFVGKDGKGGLAGAEGSRAQAEVRINREKAAKEGVQELKQLEAEIHKSIAGGTKSAVDDATAALQAFDVQVEEFNRKRKEKGLDGVDFSADRAALVAKVEAARVEERRTIESTVADFVAGATGSAADAALRQLDKQTAAIRAQIGATKELTEAEKDRLRDLLGNADILARENNRALKATENLDLELKQAGETSLQSFEALNNKQLELYALQLTLTKGSEGYKRVQEAILRIQEQRKKLAQGLLTKDPEADAERHAAEIRKHVEAQARAIRTVGDGVLRVSQAFGILDRQTESILSNIVGFATAIPAALGPLANWESSLNLALGALSVLGSIFNDSAEQERRRQIDEQIDAMIKLSNSLQYLTQQLDDSTAILGSKGPAADLEAFIKKIGPKSPFFAQLLDGKDLNNPADREAIRKMIQDLFESLGLGQGVEGLTLDDLTGRDFVDAMKKVLEYLDSLDQQQGTPGTGGYQISREITESTGGRIAGLMTSSLVFARRTAEGIEAIVAAVQGSGSIQPPAIDGGLVRSLGRSIVIEVLNLQVTVPAGTTDQDAKRIGTAVGTGLLESITKIDQGLGLRLQRRSALQTVTLN